VRVTVGPDGKNPKQDGFFRSGGRRRQGFAAARRYIPDKEVRSRRRTMAGADLSHQYSKTEVSIIRGALLHQLEPAAALFYLDVRGDPTWSSSGLIHGVGTPCLKKRPH